MKKILLLAVIVLGMNYVTGQEVNSSGNFEYGDWFSVGVENNWDWTTSVSWTNATTIKGSKDTTPQLIATKSVDDDSYSFRVARMENIVEDEDLIISIIFNGDSKTLMKYHGKGTGKNAAYIYKSKTSTNLEDDAWRRIMLGKFSKNEKVHIKIEGANTTYVLLFSLNGAAASLKVLKASIANDPFDGNNASSDPF